MYNMKKVLFILIIIIICIINFSFSIYFIKEMINNYLSNNNDDNNQNKNNNQIIFYDGKKLYHPAKKKLSVLSSKINNGTKVDCNTNLIECKVDKDCKSKCLSLPYHKIKCNSSNGLCQYNKKDSKTLCQNGGQMTSYFSLGRLHNACICPENFIGLYCQIPNEMKQNNLRTFDLVY